MRKMKDQKLLLRGHLCGQSRIPSLGYNLELDAFVPGLGKHAEEA